MSMKVEWVTLMPNFRYEAANKLTGRIEHGQIDAENERSARQLLRNQGLLPLQLDTAASRRAARLGQKHVSRAELGWLTRQLAGLLAAGLPLESVLTAALEQSEHKHLTQLLASIRSDVRAGHRFCDALSAHPSDFPATYRALVEAGEQSGELSQVMERLADYTESQTRLRNKIITALVYPAIVTVVALLIVAFLLTSVVPQVVGAFSHTQQQLPLLTRVLLAISDFSRDWGVYTLLAVGLGLAAWRFSLRNAHIRLNWHRRVLRIPVIGRYVLGVNTESFASTLSILVAGGVPLLPALEASARALGNDHLRQAVALATRMVREGSSLATALRRQDCFPALLMHLIESGERTGRLPGMLERAAATLSGELEQRAMRLTAVLEPVLTLVMGALVMFIVLAIMLPIIEINQMIQ